MNDGSHRDDQISAAVGRLKHVAVSTITNSLLKRGLRNQFLPGIAPVKAGLPNMVGPAYTLRFIPAREDIDTLALLGRGDSVQRRAIEECPAIAVLVIDSCGIDRAASAGDLMIRRLSVRGCAGIVTDGGFRDTAGIAAVGLPAYQRQTACAASPVALHPVDLDVPICCAGVAVYPGDIVVGDGEGVVIIPADIAEVIAREATEATEYEKFAERQISAGRSLFDVFPATDQSRAEFRLWQSTLPASKME